MKKIISIIGATGNVGSKTVQLLTGKGHTLRLIARHADKLTTFATSPDVEIHAGSALDSAFLTSVFKGSDVVLAMMPGDYSSTNIGASQDQMGLAILEAIKQSHVKHVLNLSSVGGHTEEKTGIVAGLARQEKRLNELADVNVLHLRPTYFMENLLGNIGMIKGMKIHGSPLKADKPFPIIASKDIAHVIAEKLQQANWTGKTIQPLLGARDYTMTEITQAIGKVIGNTELPYVEFPYDQAKQAMMNMGFTESIADAFVGLNEGINLGVFNLEERNADSTTSTSIEEFMNEVFVHAYNA